VTGRVAIKRPYPKIEKKRVQAVVREMSCWNGRSNITGKKVPFF